MDCILRVRTTSLSSSSVLSHVTNSSSELVGSSGGDGEDCSRGDSEDHGSKGGGSDTTYLYFAFLAFRGKEELFYLVDP